MRSAWMSASEPTSRWRRPTMSSCSKNGAFLKSSRIPIQRPPNALNNLEAPAEDFVSPSGLAVPRTVQVGFINNTPFRAIFTFGAYDQLNKDTVPTGFGQLRLEGNTASAQIAQPCRKTFSVGG